MANCAWGLIKPEAFENWSEVLMSSERSPTAQPWSCHSEGSKVTQGASLVVQWLRIRLPMQGTRVRALVWEDPTCRGAVGPMSHNY